MDGLTALLQSRSWVKRRTDRVELLDLTTVHRTIVLTLDLDTLAKALPPGPRLVPLGWFVPRAHAGATIVDANASSVPYLTSAESDDHVQPQIAERLHALGLPDGAAEEIRRHRAPRPGDDGHGYEQLAGEKWGCPTVPGLLETLRAGHPDDAGAPPTTVTQLVQILLAWQTNYVLFARCDAHWLPRSWATLEISFYEELQEWAPPWERRLGALGGDDLARPVARERRTYISRGGPFGEELNALAPRYLRGFLARRRIPWIRRIGRRGVLGLAWHAAWHEASGLDVASHHVEVVLPSELTAVRIRMMRLLDGATLPTVAGADQVGTRGAIVAPESDSPESALAPPTLFSLVVAQRSTAAWRGGAAVALLTGAAILTAALSIKDVLDHADDAVIVLVVAPTLVSAALSVRAGSEIAGHLTETLRRLIALVGVVAVVCAISLVVQGSAPHHHVGRLKTLWLAAGGSLLATAAALVVGAHQLRRLGDHARDDPAYDGRPSTAFNPPGAPRIPPPDRWITSGEGDLVPWGWLNPGSDASDPEDEWYWKAKDPHPLASWVSALFSFHVAEPEPHAAPKPLHWWRWAVYDEDAPPPRRRPLGRLAARVRPPRMLER